MGDVAKEFEQSRVEMFARHGLDASAEWLVDTAGRRTAAVVGGSGESTTLLVHGAISDAGEWSLMAPHLDGRLVAVDWPGSGLTPPVDIRGLGIRRFAVEWLDSVIEAIRQPVRIVGSSAGGYVALLYALARPQHVTPSRPGRFASRPDRRPRSSSACLRHRSSDGSYSVINPRTSRAYGGRVFANLFANADRIPVDVLRGSISRRITSAGAPHNAPGFSRAAGSTRRRCAKDLVSGRGLGALAVPVHLLWGSADNFLEPDAALARFTAWTRSPRRSSAGARRCYMTLRSSCTRGGLGKRVPPLHLARRRSRWRRLKISAQVIRQWTSDATVGTLPGDSPVGATAGTIPTGRTSTHVSGHLWTQEWSWGV